MPKKKRSRVVSVKKKRRQGGKGEPFMPGNPWRFPKGVSPNPGGRPKRLGESLAKLLEAEDLESHLSVAELLARRIIEDAMNGSVADRREIRLITEGETVHTPDLIQVFMDR